MSRGGVEQLETHFGRYLSQLSYVPSVPPTLFSALSLIDPRTATLLFLVAPLIPLVVTPAMLATKRLLNCYSDICYGLGDSPFEKLQGMTTLKTYQADWAAAGDMDWEPECFQKIATKVLTV